MATGTCRQVLFGSRTPRWSSVTGTDPPRARVRASPRHIPSQELLIPRMFNPEAALGATLGILTTTIVK